MSSEAINLRDDFKGFLNSMANSFAQMQGLRQQEATLRRLYESVDKPFTLAVFGRMKTGKSSIINSLVRRKLAITGVEEATATINWISYGDTSQESSMIVHWKDGRSEPVDFSRLSEWAGKDPDVLKRVSDTAWLQLFSNAPSLKNIQIVDTPGTGSVANEHEEAAQDFLSPRAAEASDEEGRKADALMYVFPPVARETDADALSSFQHTRLPGSDPFNSIGVLHKWDGLETDDGDIATEARRKAAKLRNALGDYMSDVVPVSAPLAMVARHAPDSYLNNLLQITSDTEKNGGLAKSLKRDSRWKGDTARAMVRDSYDVPWVSFVRVVHSIRDFKPTSADELRNICEEMSGFLDLEKQLDQRFFKRAAIIKQRLARVKAKDAIQTGLMRINQKVDELEMDLRNYKSIQASGVANGGVKTWLDRKIVGAEREHLILENEAVAADEIWLKEELRMKLMEGDLRFIQALKDNPTWVEERDVECIEAILGLSNEEYTPPKALIPVLLERYQPMLNAPLSTTRKHFEHLIGRLNQLK